jgi:hypothetical protein
MEVLMGKSSINRPFSMAMLNNQRVSGESRFGFEHRISRILGGK